MLLYCSLGTLLDPGFSAGLTSCDARLRCTAAMPREVLLLGLGGAGARLADAYLQARGA
jgi:hypothetical protein